MKLISESIEDIEYITEDNDDGKKNYRIKGVFLQADIKNRNGRVYTMSVLQKEHCLIFQHLALAFHK